MEREKFSANMAKPVMVDRIPVQILIHHYLNSADRHRKYSMELLDLVQQILTEHFLVNSDFQPNQ